MFDKLARRNVKRQLSSYVIYFVTVTLTIAMMFALCNVIYSEEVLSYAHKMSQLMQVLVGISVFIAVIVSCVLGYAASFMLKLRKHEFGMYLTLGMTRKDIIKMFAFENLIIGAGALLSGLLLGLFLYQGVIGIIARILDFNISLGSYSLSGLILTTVLTVGMFLLSTYASSFYLKKTSIYDLLHARTAVNQTEKHPVIWGILTVFSFGGVIYSIIMCNNAIDNMFHTSTEEGMAAAQLMLGLLILSICVILYHIGLSKSLIFLLLRNKKLKCRNTNTFVLRQLSGQLRANSVQCGILSFLILAAIIGTNMSFGEKATVKQFISKELPFDITVNLTANANAPFSYQKSKEIINSYVPIEEEIPYTVYTTNNNYLLSFTPYTGDSYEHLYDSFMSESDFNRLITKLGYAPVSLQDEFLVIANVGQIGNCDFSQAVLTISQTTYHLLDVSTDYPMLSRIYFYTVVPDEAVKGMEVETQYIAIDLKNQKFDGERLEQDLTYIPADEYDYGYEECNYYIRACYELQENSMVAILIVGSLYLSLIFIFLAIAIMTMKLLSEVSNDKKRYELLYRLGVTESDQKKAMFRQILSFFVVPFLLPLCLSVPVAYLCGKIVSYGGYTNLVPQMYQNAALISLLLIVVQSIYFLATYTIEKRIIK